MIARSRKRGYRELRIIAVAVVITNSSARTTGSSSQPSRGSIPNASMKTTATIRLKNRLKDDVTTTDRGITSRGNWVLRTTASFDAIDGTAVLVASWKK